MYQTALLSAALFSVALLSAAKKSAKARTLCVCFELALGELIIKPDIATPLCLSKLTPPPIAL